MNVTDLKEMLSELPGDAEVYVTKDVSGLCFSFYQDYLVIQGSIIIGKITDGSTIKHGESYIPPKDES